MKGKRAQQEGSQAVALLATSIVLTLGLLTCLAVAVSGAGGKNGLWICLACFAGIGLILWGIYDSTADRPVGDRNSLFFWRPRQKKSDDYIAIRRRELTSDEALPDVARRPEPPSAESVRRLREENAVKTWLPAPLASGQIPPATSPDELRN